MCICIDIHIHIYIYINIYIYMYMYTYIFIYIYVYVHTYYIYVYNYRHIYLFSHVCEYIYMYTYIHAKTSEQTAVPLVELSSILVSMQFCRPSRRKLERAAITGAGGSRPRSLKERLSATSLWKECRNTGTVVRRHPDTSRHQRLCPDDKRRHSQKSAHSSICHVKWLQSWLLRI